MIRAVGVDQADGAASATGAPITSPKLQSNIANRRGSATTCVVVSSVEAVRAVSVDIHQRVMRGEEQLTDARVTAAFLDRDGRPQRQPKDWVERFNRIATGK